MPLNGQIGVIHEQLPDGEALVEFGGRLCYKSWKEGLKCKCDKGALR